MASVTMFLYATFGLGSSGMRAEIAARIFHDWALAEGLMSESLVSPISTAADYALIAPVLGPGVQLLRSKRILNVGFNEASREIVAYTRNAAPSGKKAVASLPARVDDVKISYRQGNNVSAGDNPAAAQGGPPYTIRAIAAGSRHYTCGSSISVGNCVDAGTMGALVRDGAGNIYGLSNNHVSGSCSHAEVGLPIVAPGIADVMANSLNPFTLGLHSKALPMLIGTPTVVSIADNTDAATFTLEDISRVSSYQGDAYDTPVIVAPLSAGMTVEKVGRTTGHTRGVVQSQVYGPSAISYAAARYGFTGNILFPTTFVIHGLGDSFSDHGDSGSLITSVINGQRSAVGLVFAGGNDSKAPGGKITYALPLAPILAALGVTLVSGHNV